jgi:hypothetical protein
VGFGVFESFAEYWAIVNDANIPFRFGLFAVNRARLHLSLCSNTAKAVGRCSSCYFFSFKAKSSFLPVLSLNVVLLYGLVALSAVQSTSALLRFGNSFSFIAAAPTSSQVSRGSLGCDVPTVEQLVQHPPKREFIAVQEANLANF